MSSLKRLLPKLPRIRSRRFGFAIACLRADMQLLDPATATDRRMIQDYNDAIVNLESLRTSPKARS